MKVPLLCMYQEEEERKEEEVSPPPSLVCLGLPGKMLLSRFTVYEIPSIQQGAILIALCLSGFIILVIDA